MLNALSLVQLWPTTNAMPTKVNSSSWIACGREITCCDSYLITFDSIQKLFAHLMPILCIAYIRMWYEAMSSVHCPWTVIIMNSSLVAGWTCLTEKESLVCGKFQQRVISTTIIIIICWLDWGFLFPFLSIPFHFVFFSPLCSKCNFSGIIDTFQSTQR